MKNQSLSASSPLGRQSFPMQVDPDKVYRSIIDVVFAIDEYGIFQYVSPSCFHLFGYSSQEMTGASFLDFIHPDDIEKTIRIIS
ncbi:MAG TPA: PAS domain S-box protein, partial [Flavisolibacter sp.]|nr:PAS domain S-box protein [Flavisolibacter sp.]